MGSAGIPPLDFAKPDGSQLSRYEMDVQTREKWHKVHWLRLMAIQQYGLPKQISYDMREIVLRQWVLDEMIRRGQVLGNVLGVNAQSHNDEAEMRQFAQKLAAFVQANQTVLPKEGEGIDMTQFTPPPPPMMGAPVPQNGQPQTPAFAPPPMPGGFPPAPGAPMAPPAGPPQYTAPPGFAPGPVGPPAMPPGIPQGFPQQPPSYPPQAAPPTAPPQAAQGGGRKRGPKPADAAPAPIPGAAPVPPMPTAPPAGFAPAMPPAAPGFPSAPGFPTAAPIAAPQGIATSPGVDLTPVFQRLDQLAAQCAAQQAQLANASMVITFLARVVLQKQGSVEAAELLKEFGHTPR